MKYQNKTFFKFIIVVVVIIAIGIGIVIYNLPKFDKFFEKIVTESITDGFEEFFCDGYSDLKIYENGVDTGLYLFTFVCPEDYNSLDVSAQIKKDREDFNILIDNDEMLAMQKPDPKLHPEGFQEVRVRFRPTDNKVIVFVGYFDSETDFSLYPTMLEKFSEKSRN
ncbi:hypothetical protein HQ571_01865 [Candidatus Kuenenbacteria bacterium]|nr:hypothetical protein [Candidatus Kuenenbacteria bacterium]